jgi:hypothetical protein
MYNAEKAMPLIATTRGGAGGGGIAVMVLVASLLCQCASGLTRPKSRVVAFCRLSRRERALFYLAKGEAERPGN